MFFLKPRRTCEPLTRQEALFLHLRALNMAEQARISPGTARVAGAWLALAARRAQKRGLPALALRLTALQRRLAKSSTQGRLIF